MKTILWIGNPFFGPSLETLLRSEVCSGKKLWGTSFAAWRITQQVPPAGSFFTWEDCVRLAGTEPDLLVVCDTSSPPFVLGVEHFPCPTVFYAVDTHIHSWMPWYGQAFDACLISLKDHLPLFQGKRLPDERLWWSPPYAPDLPAGPAMFPAGNKTWDALFVGSLDPLNLPLRHHFLNHLAELLPTFRVEQGYFTHFYPFARVVVNICELGDLNFRVFESMGCGAALVTPAVGHGQAVLFAPGRHMLTFDVPGLSSDGIPPGDIPHIGALAAEHAAQAIVCLRDNARRETMARAAWKEINRAHRACHRAAAFLDHIQTIPVSVASRRVTEATSIRKNYLKLLYLLWGNSMPDSPLKEAYIQAACGKI